MLKDIIRKIMDTFENATPPTEQEEKIVSKCWECEEEKLCFEFIVCCTGTHFYVCDECRKEIEKS